MEESPYGLELWRLCDSRELAEEDVDLVCTRLIRDHKVRLVYLFLVGMSVAADTLVRLATALGQNTTVTYVYLSMIGVSTGDSSEALACVARIPEINHSIKTLEIDNMRFQDRHGAILSHALSRNVSIQNVHLDHTSLTDAGLISIITKLATHPTVRTFSFEEDSSTFTISQVSAICQAIRTTRLCDTGASLCAFLVKLSRIHEDSREYRPLKRAIELAMAHLDQNKQRLSEHAFKMVEKDQNTVWCEGETFPDSSDIRVLSLSGQVRELRRPPNRRLARVEQIRLHFVDCRGVVPEYVLACKKLRKLELIACGITSAPAPKTAKK